ncbi:MAG: GNAT family N-acetyltransferase [Verrucomicrobia bacterium]|nr:GNAT family N-acetyltransferase [Verrucomicrobiota bacterium]
MVSQLSHSLAPRDDSHAIIKTSIVKNPKKIKFLQKETKAWSNHAEVRYEIGEFLKKYITKDQRRALESSEIVVSDIRNSLATKSVRHKKVYVARDGDNVVQAIAIVAFKAKKNEIKLIATNPENMPVFGYEKATRGGGTALITHIVRDSMQKRHKRGLYLNSIPSAVGFYEKLGFVGRSRTRSDWLKPMVLRTEKMQALVGKHMSEIKVQKHEPRKSGLKFKKESELDILGRMAV